MKTTISKLRRTIRRTILEAYGPNMERYTNMAMMPYYEDAILGMIPEYGMGGVNMSDLATDIMNLMGEPNDYFPPNEMTYKEQFFDFDTFGAACKKLEGEGKIVQVRMDPRGPVYELA